MTDPDALVIGAGPAGAAAASRLARAGARTVLIDRDAFPRPKLCGGCLARAGRESLERMGLLDALDSVRHAPSCTSLELVSGTRRTRITIPEYRVVDRSSFDMELVDAARAMGVVFWAETAASVRPDGSVSIVDGPHARVYRPRVVIVADGLSGSSLKDHPGFGWRIEPGAPVGLGAILSRLPARACADAVTMFHGPMGYAGIAPLMDGRAIVAAAADPGWIRDHARGGALPALLGALGLGGDIGDAIGRVRGAPVLTRRRERVEHAGRVFVIGDAAGYVEPFTGEGMSWAIEHAERVAPLALRAIEGHPRIGAWTRAFTRSRRRRTRLCGVTGSVLRRPALARSLVGLCGRSRGAADLAGAFVSWAQRPIPAGAP